MNNCYYMCFILTNTYITMMNMVVINISLLKIPIIITSTKYECLLIIITNTNIY